MSEVDERELFVRRVIEDLQILWLGSLHLSFEELLETIEMGDDEYFSGNLRFEVEQMVSD